jgi:hypothetical protein
MQKVKSIQVSSAFKSAALQSIIAIIIFIVSYLAMITFSLALTYYCTQIGMGIITSGRGVFVIIAGAALILFGFLVLFFLIKFIFATNKVATDGMTQIYEDEHPKLFAVINDIVNQVGTHFPKKVFLSNDVNAYVFYNSNF